MFFLGGALIFRAPGSQNPKGADSSAVPAEDSKGGGLGEPCGRLGEPLGAMLSHFGLTKASQMDRLSSFGIPLG